MPLRACLPGFFHRQVRLRYPREVRFCAVVSLYALLSGAISACQLHAAPAPVRAPHSIFTDIKTPAPPAAGLRHMPTGRNARGVVLITVDTLRADSLGSYGNPQVLSLNADRLVSGGTLFRQAFAQATTTSPSHASLMTSLYLQDHNVYSNFDALGDDPVTLAEAFKAQGFATFAIVNMRHLNPEVLNLAQGFDVYIHSGNMRRAGSTIDRFLQWVDTLPPNKKFFAWLHVVDVHTPYHPPAPYDRFYYGEDERDPRNRSLARIWPLLPLHMSDHPLFTAWLEGITDLSWVLAQYHGAVSYVDNELGRLLDALEDRQLLDRTAMVLTADHGECLGEHNMYFVHTGLYEPTVHVPLIMYFPGAELQGRQVRNVVELIDVYPTLLEYFNIRQSLPLRGHSLWPLMRGAVQPERLAFIEHAGRNLLALRSTRYKYIRHLRTNHLQPSYPFIAGKEELYDVQEDPGERQDLAKARPDVLQVFREEAQARQHDRMNIKSGTPTLTRDTVEMLRALGYVR